MWSTSSTTGRWGSEALAVATTWANEQGAVVSFDIRVNARVGWTTEERDDRYDLQAAVTHEVGHVLGLEHSTVEDATMYPAHDLGDAWRQQLHTDDQEAVQYLYSESAVSGRPDDSSLACASAPGVLWMALLPLPFLRRRRDARPRC